MFEANHPELITQPATANTVFEKLFIRRSLLKEWRETDPAFPWSTTIGKDGRVCYWYDLEICRKRQLALVTGREAV